MVTNFFRKNHPTVLTPRPPRPWARGRNAPLSFKRGAGGEDFLLPLFWRGLGGGLLLLCLPFVLSAQNGVTVSNLAVEAGTVTFNVSWDKAAMPQNMGWSDSVWVFVDYNNNGTMERLPLLPGATLISASPGGKVIEETDNNKGVWVVGNARSAGSFSTTVQLLIDTDAMQCVSGGACAYASNYPPVAEYTNATHILFKGTAPYKMVLKHESGTTITRSSGSDYEVPANYTVQSFIDKTGAPGIIKCITPTAQTLAASAQAFCAGSSGVQLSLLGTQSGVKYWLYRNSTAIGAVLPGSGSAATFSGAYTAGTYTAQSVRAGAFCEAAMNGTVVVNAVATPVTPKIAISAGTACQHTDVTFNVANPVAGATYTWSGNPAGVAGGTGNATYTVNASADVKSASVYSRITSSGITCQSANAATVTVSVVAPAAPAVVQSAFCYGLPGQLIASAASGVNIAWYDAPTDGNKLGDGNVLPLTPLCNVSASYYAEARTANNCVSSRTQADYAVNHCVVDGTCPCFDSGSINSTDSQATPVACSAFDAGQIGSARATVACSVFDAGQIGSARAPAACVSFDAGWIGK